jgi:hypothetical protein
MCVLRVEIDRDLVEVEWADGDGGGLWTSCSRQ